MSTIFENGRFFTGQDDVFADCMIVEDGIIAYLGHKDDAPVSLVKEKKASVVNMHNRVALPGFIDGHMHLLMLGQSLNKVNLEPCKNLDDIRFTIKSYALSHPTVPRILCRGWMHPMTGGLALASMLDDLDERPIFIDSKDLHSTWCNRAALEELGIESAADPSGGVIHRDQNGKPSGLLSEAAAVNFVWPYVAKYASTQEKLDALKGAITAYTKVGYTGMVDMAMDENAWKAVQLLRSKEDLPFRLAAYWLIRPSDDEAENSAQVDRAIALHEQFNAETSPDCRIVGIKLICDGVVDACTAALCEPYSNGTNSDTLWSTEMLYQVVKRADSAGLQCALHAIGDQAIKLAVDTLEPFCGPGKRHRIEHLELASARDAERLGKLGITASIQPVHADSAILRAWPKLLGEHRCGRAFPYNEFLEGGAELALGSDSPTAPYAPLRNLYTAVTRRSTREPESIAVVNEKAILKLGIAVSAATAGAAYSCFADKRTGHLKKGFKADFVILDMDWTPENLLHARVCQTWFEGKKVFDIEQ